MLLSFLEAVHLEILELVGNLALFGLKLCRQEIKASEGKPRKCSDDEKKTKETGHLERPLPLQRVILEGQIGFIMSWVSS